MRIAFLSLVNYFRAATNLHSACNGSLKTAMSSTLLRARTQYTVKYAMKLRRTLLTSSCFSRHREAILLKQFSPFCNYAASTTSLLPSKSCSTVPVLAAECRFNNIHAYTCSNFKFLNALRVTGKYTETLVRVQKLPFWIAVYSVTVYKNSCIFEMEWTSAFKFLTKSLKYLIMRNLVRAKFYISPTYGPFSRGRSHISEFEVSWNS